MAKYPDTAATTKPTMSSGPNSPDPMRSGSWVSPAPAIAGIPSRNENRAASTGENFLPFPALIVMPDLEMPGMGGLETIG